jgi:hypothetical protein
MRSKIIGNFVAKSKNVEGIIKSVGIFQQSQ